jgi:hypothetical protein
MLLAFASTVILSFRPCITKDHIFPHFIGPIDPLYTWSGYKITELML